MSKNRFNLPILLTLPTPTDENEWGGGTGLGGEHGTPMSFSSWLNSQWKADSDHDGDFDEYDYGDW